MSASSAQFQFAAEFVLFLAAASGLAVVALRSALLNRETIGTTALAIGFTSFATSAFLHGSALVDDGGAPLVLALRAAGVAALVVGVVRGWVAGSLARGLLVASAALVGAATVIDADTAGTAARVLLTAGGAALGGSVVAASTRSIAARFAATAAMTLLIVVLVLGVAVSAVLVNTVEDSAVQRLEGRAATEAAAARYSFLDYLENAKIVAFALTGKPATVLAAARATESSDLLSSDLKALSSQFLDNVALAYVGPTGAVQGVFNISTPESVLELAGSSVVAEVIQRGGQRGSIDLIGDRAVAVGAYPVDLPPGVEQVDGIEGVVVALVALDDNYLTLRAQDDNDLALAMFANSGPVATHGVQPPEPGTSAMVRATLVDGRASSGLVEDRFVAVTPVLASDGTPTLALVASTPTTLVNRTRDELFRNLFLVALGGAMLALLFASLVGARIGAGLSRLRTAAEAIEGGNFNVRSGVRSDDEVGVLGRTFDSMAESVQEKTAAEIRLRGRLEAVVAGMGEALVAVDGNGVVTDFNRAAEQLVGVHQSEAVGRPFADVVRLVGDDGTAFAATATAPGRPSTLGWVATNNGGGPVPVAVSVGVLQGTGSDAGGRVLVLADLTREREVEQMKTQFLTRVGHELRHPLVPMMGYAEILTRREVPSEQAREMHQEMLAQSKVLLRIVEMLEFFAAAGAGRVSLRREMLDPKPLVEEVARRWQAKAPGHTVRRVRTRKPVPPVFADRRRLVKCLDELLDNAVKFSPAGGTVSITVEAVEGGVEIGVLDHGIGMTEDEQEKVFAEFVKADPSDTTPYAGLGLGLAFVRRVVEAHGGVLTCRSAVGKGSKLSIFLPDVPKEEAG